MNHFLIVFLYFLNLKANNKNKINKRCIRPKFSAAGDTIFRAGEKAEEFFIIKSGRIGVFANDSNSLMAILEEGAFFGEISLLLTRKRTMTIKCLADTELLTIKNQRLLNILDLFPDEKSHLMAIAKQRLKTTNKHDIPLKEV